MASDVRHMGCMNRITENVRRGDGKCCLVLAVQAVEQRTLGGNGENVRL